MSRPNHRTPAETSGRSKLSFLLVGILLAGSSLVGLGCSRDPGPNDFSSVRTIEITAGAAKKGNRAFSPNPANCTRNTLVIWTNRDSLEHRVVSTGGYFDSGIIKPGQSYQLVFRATRTFIYHDEMPHSNVQGVLNVLN